MNSEIKLFNKKSIVFFSTVLSPLFGALLYGQNLWIVGQGKKMIWPIVFTLVYFPLINNVLKRTSLNPLIIVFAAHFIGGLILVFAFWNEQIGKELAYKSKKIWGPLIVTLVIYGTYFGLVFYKYYFG